MSGSQVAHRKRDDPEKQRQWFIDRFDPQIRPLIRGVRRAFHRRLPTANELVYDNYNFFVIGYTHLIARPPSFFLLPRTRTECAWHSSARARSCPIVTIWLLVRVIRTDHFGSRILT